ncbi:tyrosine-type recombinase/integrase [Kribbella sp. NPDC023972]|uniref:tyrosine-type recombinase/integrase n=1 Tax=Kribbella sp. NPDC023972 TaxID=3154795 RepID=UPI00340B5206
MAKVNGRKKRDRGGIDVLPSGAVRVRVYAGIDPVSKRRHDLTEVIPAGPDAEKLAEEMRVRLLNQVYERRNPRTKATVNQLLDKYLSEADLEFNTLDVYKGYADKHIRPLLGGVKVGSLDAGIMDSLYAELRRCRDHCKNTKGQIDHRTTRKHECDERCRPHTCKPLAASTIRQIHFILYGALRRAVRWKWVTTNPIADAEPPAAPKGNPRPPTPEQAARIINEAFKDPDWGALIWLTMITGQRRGELCAIRWLHVDLDNGVLHLEKAIGQRSKKTWEKDTKAHQDRRITLDPETIELLREHKARAHARAEALQLELADDAFVFSLAPDGSAHLIPDSVTQRYSKLANRLGIKTTLHKLRHYSATELIAAGVDIRTVAGRLGHGGGGTTTLRAYTAWVSESDQRAAGSLASRMPIRPGAAPTPTITLTELDPTSPYERIAVDLRTKIMQGTLRPGLPIPPVKAIAAEHGTSVSTAQRAVKLLDEWGLVEINSGRRTLVKYVALAAASTAATSTNAPNDQAQVSVGQERLLDLEVRQLGKPIAKFRASADPDSSKDLRQLLVGAIRRSGGDLADIGDYELAVSLAGSADLMTTFVATR